MKREIKFRAWDKDDKAMREIRSIEWDSSELHRIDFHDGFYKDWKYDAISHIILLQFTGLKDKNGKDLYEGDIVKSHDAVWDNTPLETGGEPDMVFKEVVGAIEYRGRGFWIIGESFGWEGEEMWNWDDLEIIGNIYENKELITH